MWVGECEWRDQWVCSWCPCGQSVLFVTYKTSPGRVVLSKLLPSFCFFFFFHFFPLLFVFIASQQMLDNYLFLIEFVILDVISFLKKLILISDFYKQLFLLVFHQRLMMKWQRFQSCGRAYHSVGSCCGQGHL